MPEPLSTSSLSNSPPSTSAAPGASSASPSLHRTSLHSNGLRRSLGFWTASAVVVGSIIGSGIFLVSSDMIKAVGSPGMVFVVWVFGGVLSLLGALTYAELAAAMPEAGGEYAYLNRAFGPAWGFIHGWANSLVGFSASIAAKVAALYTYCAVFFPGLKDVLYTVPLPIGSNGGPLEINAGQLLGIVLVLVLMGVNYVGVRAGGRVQVFTTGLKMLLIFGIIAAGLVLGRGSSANLHSSVVAVPGGVAGFFAALVAALWAYDGWNYAGTLGADVENPGRNLPKVLILGTGAVIAIYLLTNLAYFYVLPAAEVASSNAVAANMMRRAIGGSGAAIVTVAALVSIFASLNASLLTGPRLPFAMARKGYFFRSLGEIHPKYETPSKSLVWMALWSCLLLLSGRFDELYRMVIFTEWIFYALACSAAIVLRIKEPQMPRPYRIIGYPWVPLAFVIVSIGLLYSTLVTYPWDSGKGLLLIAAGLPFYFYWRRSAPEDKSGFHAE
jgi:APA family basic amino acid/polyamine antiporter